MRLDRLPGTTRRQEYDQMEFGGYMHRRGAPDGSIWDMLNLCGDEAPLLVTRKKRKRSSTDYDAINGIYAVADKLLILNWDGNALHGTEVIYDGLARGELTGQDTKRRFVYMEGRVIIWPDMYVLNVKYDTRGDYATLTDLQNNVSNPKEGWCYRVGISTPYELYVYDGTQWVSNGPELYPMAAHITRLHGVTFDNDTVHTTYGSVIDLGSAPGDAIKVGDAVTISGCVTHPENNKTAIIRDIVGNDLYFYDGTFTLDAGNTPYSETGVISIRRTVPKLDFICVHENRLWGCGADGLVYGSKLGDPTNFYVYDGLSTDSVFLDEGTAGAFTAAYSYGGYARFFKENEIWTLYGTLPEDFALKCSAHTGVKSGEADSLAIAGEALYYMSPEGFMQYAGAMPAPVHEAFGEEKLSSCMAGSDGRKYFVCAASAERNMRTMYVYDTLLGRWYRESLAPGRYTTTVEGLTFEGFTCMGGVLFGYANDSEYDPDDGYEYNARIWAVSNADRLPSLGYIDELDSALTWFLETGDFGADSNSKSRTYTGMSVKTVDRLYLRAESNSHPVVITINYDSGTAAGDTFAAGMTGQWPPTTWYSTLKSQYEFPIIPRRADHYRLKIEGGGMVRLYALGRSWHTGSHTWTRKPT